MNLKCPFHKFQAMFKERFRQQSTAGGVVRGSKGSRKDDDASSSISSESSSMVLLPRETLELINEAVSEAVGKEFARSLKMVQL